MLQTATLPIFIRALSLASVHNDMLMYNLQAHPVAEVAYMMEWNNWGFWHLAYGVLVDVLVSFVSMFTRMIDCSLCLFLLFVYLCPLFVS